MGSGIRFMVKGVENKLECPKKFDNINPNWFLTQLGLENDDASEVLKGKRCTSSAGDREGRFRFREKNI